MIERIKILGNNYNPTEREVVHLLSLASSNNASHRSLRVERLTLLPSRLQKTTAGLSSKPPCSDKLGKVCRKFIVSKIQVQQQRCSH